MQKNQIHRNARKKYLRLWYAPVTEIRIWEPMAIRPPGVQKSVARPKTRWPKSFFINHKDEIKGTILP